MIVCVNTYRVKPGLRSELVKEITGKNIPQELRALQGNLYFNFSAAVDDEDVLYLTDAWCDEESFAAHLKNKYTLLWLDLKEKYVAASDVKRYDIA